MLDAVKGFAINHRSHIGRQLGRVAQHQFLRRALLVNRLLSAAALDESAARQTAPTLLLAALAEIHANAEMFGGQERISFKALWKYRGRALCKRLGVMK